jgi:ATP-dependent protease ClpP protease subunit
MSLRQVTIKPQPNADFRPNPERGVYISGPITQVSLDRLTPVILKYQTSSRAPITLFIDSPGGDLRSTDSLQKLLRAADQDSLPPCRIITVVTATAASAGADLLASGDYALAYPHARILCHGVRQAADVLTREAAMQLAQRMATSNEGFALELARNCISRFVFRCVLLKSEFDSIRRRPNSQSLSDSHCLTIALQDRVSASLRQLLLDSFTR